VRSLVRVGSRTGADHIVVAGRIAVVGTAVVVCTGLVVGQMAADVVVAVHRIVGADLGCSSWVRTSVVYERTMREGSHRGSILLCCVNGNRSNALNVISLASVLLYVIIVLTLRVNTT
jgi:hypothetical protein